MFNNVVVVGVGSIGIKHALFLKQYSKNLILVDPILKSTERADKYSEFDKVLKLTSIQNLGLEFKKGDLAVISNWGPDHYKTLISLVSKGLKDFVLEKPCADSLLEIEKIWKVARKHNLRVAVNQGWYYDKLGLKINKIGKKLGLGEVKAIFVSGGARCISTAGSHWISLANQIFMNNPKFIFSSAKNDSINPRSKKLSYYEGVYSFNYANDKRLAICLTNSSSVEGRVEIYWRDAIGILQSEKLRIYSRGDFPNQIKITKYGPASKLIYSEPLNDQKQSFLNLYRSFKIFKKDAFFTDLKNHLNVTRSILFALISSETGVRLNFHKKPDKGFHDRKFKIS